MDREVECAWVRALAAESVFFRDLPAEELDRWLNDPRCIPAVYPRRAAIYTPRQFQRCLGLLLSGTVQVNKGVLIVSVLGPGALFGAAALFGKAEDYASTLTARSPCRVLLFPQALVEERLAACPAAARSYIAYLSDRIRFLTGKIDGLTAGSAGRKLAQYLLAQPEGGPVELDCPATVLAKRLHVSRASLYRAFDALTAAGAVERTGRTIRLLDPDLLRRL